MNTTEWKTISDIEEYEISNDGRVRNKSSGKILKTQFNPYERLTLISNGKSVLRYVHRLVAEAFIPNICNKSHVNHIDENKRNNHMSNLEWVTVKENNQHGTRIERVIKSQGHSIIILDKSSQNEYTFDSIHQAGLFFNKSSNYFTNWVNRNKIESDNYKIISIGGILND